MGVGGAHIKVEADMVLLDNTYMLRQFRERRNISGVSNFTRFATNYAKNTKVSLKSTLPKGKTFYKGIGSKIQRKIWSFDFFAFYGFKLIEMTDIKFQDQFVCSIRFF